MHASVSTRARPQRSSLRRYAGGAQPALRLVCFPWCGAGASVYRKLANSLPEHIELLAVQLPGREDRFAEGKLLRMQQVVAHVLGDIANLADLPLVLFGHSMGALVAYEVALALRGQLAREPAALIVSGHAAPDAAAAHDQGWHRADDEAFIANLRRLGGTPDEVLADAQMMHMLLPMLRADYEILEHYVYSPGQVLSCPLLACAGERDGEVTEMGMQAWRRYSSAASEVHWFSGDHFYVGSQVQELSQRLQNWLAPSGFIFSCEALQGQCSNS